jgi:hypothetical protein
MPEDRYRLDYQQCLDVLAYFREEPLEVDAVLEGSWGNWAIEVKTGAFAAADLRGLSEFVRRHKRFQPLVLCDPGGLTIAARLGLAAMSWSEFLLRGLRTQDSPSD